MAVFCTKCGTSLPSAARFCSNCGATVTAMPPMGARHLYRPFAGRQVAGVCAALALAYGWDVALVRIVTVVGFFCSGGTVAVAYLACWIGIPEEPVGLPMEYPPTVPSGYPPRV